MATRQVSDDPSIPVKCSSNDSIVRFSSRRSFSISERYKGSQDADAAQYWESFCKEEKDLSERPPLEWPHQLRNENFDLKPPASRNEEVRGSVNIHDVREGIMDLAELRHDGTNSYYSAFTPPSITPPGCLMGTPFEDLTTFLLFVYCGLKNLVFREDSLFLLTLGFISLFLSNYFNVRVTIEKGPVFVGIIFPLVFLIGQNYVRREKAGQRIAGLRANSVHLVLKLLHGSGDMSKADPDRAAQTIEIIERILEEIADFMPQDAILSGPRLSVIYGLFGELQAIKETGMLTRLMLTDFEKLRMQRDYRTPWNLNYFCSLFGYFSPALMGPVFSLIGCADDNCGYGDRGGYVSMAFFALMMGALLAVVKDLEDPFDFNGFDDVLMQFKLERNAIMHHVEDVERRLADEKKATGSAMPTRVLGATSVNALRSRAAANTGTVNDALSAQV